MVFLSGLQELLLGDGIRGITPPQNLADVTLVKRLAQTGTTAVWTGIVARTS